MMARNLIVLVDHSGTAATRFSLHCWVSLEELFEWFQRQGSIQMVVYKLALPSRTSRGNQLLILMIPCLLHDHHSILFDCLGFFCREEIFHIARFCFFLDLPERSYRLTRSSLNGPSHRLILSLFVKHLHFCPSFSLVLGIRFPSKEFSYFLRHLLHEPVKNMLRRNSDSFHGPVLCATIQDIGLFWKIHMLWGYVLFSSTSSSILGCKLICSLRLSWRVSTLTKRKKWQNEAVDIPWKLPKTYMRVYL